MSSTESAIKVQVKLYATLTKYVGRSIMHEPMEVNLVKGATLATLYDRLGILGDEVKTAFVNSKMQPDDYVLCDGDHVGVFPPVGGG
jgi:molybdopterin converting factor small subunit